MKKLVSILLLLALCLSTFAACAKDNNDPAASTEASTEAGTPAKKASVEDAAAYLFNLYKNESATKPTNTPADYEIVGKVLVAGVSFDVEWKVDVADITLKAAEKDGFILVDVPEKSKTEIKYVLTATVKDAEGNTATKTFERVVPQYAVLSYAEYYAAEANAPIVIEGIVVAVHSKEEGNKYNQLYVMDENHEGGYYVYSMDKDPVKDLGIKAGMTVSVSGTKDIYQGTHEVKNASVEILDSTIKELKPLDITETFKNAADMKDANLVSKLGMLVTIKGAEITTQDTATETSQYYKFKLGNNETYIRIYDTDLPASVTDAMKATLIKNHTEKLGHNADVTGVVILYSGAIYLNPINDQAFANFYLPTRTDAEKIDTEMGAVKVPERVTSDMTITVPVAGVTYPEVNFAWTSDNACAVVDAATGKITVTLPEADATVTITLTVTCGTETKTITYKVIVEAASTDLYLPEKVETPVKDTAYKFFLNQVKLGKIFYFAGYMDGYYLATTEKADKAVDVYLEAVEGKENAYLLYFMDGETKTYIEVYERTAGEAGKGKGSVRFVTTAPANYYTLDATTGTLFHTSADGLNVYYLGTYGNYNTFSVSNASYITGDKANSVGVSQFVGNFATLVPATYVPEKVETPVKDTAYKFFLNQVKLGKIFYFAGYMDGYYLATTEKADKAVDVYLEAVEGKENAYLLYFMDGETKTYIEVYERTAGEAGKGKGSVRFVTTAPANYYTLDATTGTLFHTSADGLNVYYLGTYGTYNTFSVSNASYITGDKANSVGVSQFVGNFATLKLVEVAPVVEKTPAKDTEYELILNQANLGKTFYFAGYLDGYYLATTEKISKSVKVYLEAVEGKENAYLLYFMDGETKTYIEVYERTAGEAGKGKGSVRFVTTAPTNYYTIDATTGTLFHTSADGLNVYYLGTYGTYKTFSVSNASYITGDKASSVGVSQFPAGFATIQIVTEEEAPAAPVIVPEFGADDFSKTNPFENATIVIQASSCETGSVVMTNTEGSKYHLFNKDNNAGAAGHGVYKLIQDGVFHYYIDMASVNKTIEKEYGADYKIAAVEDCYIRWTFTVTEAGTYTFGSYMRLKDGKDRCCQIQIDDQAPLVMHYTISDDEVKALRDETQGLYLNWDGVEVELEAGDHTITYSFPAERTAASSWHWRTIFLTKKAA